MCCNGFKCEELFLGQTERVPSLQFSVLSRSEILDRYIVAAAATKSLSNAKVEYLCDVSSF